MTNDSYAGQLYTYNAENELLSRTLSDGSTTAYLYDTAGMAVKRTDHSTNWTVYIGGQYEVHQDGSVTKYYDAFGRHVAVRQVASRGGAGTLSSLLSDQLGSTVGVTDMNGTVLATQHYYPYGGPRSGSVTQTDKLFTGQRQESGDADLSLYNYNARFYSTTLGVFVSADTSMQDGLDQFAYVKGNPLTFSDPTGHGTIDSTTSLSACPPARPECSSDGGPPPTQDQTPCDWVCGVVLICTVNPGAPGGGASAPGQQPGTAPAPTSLPVPDSTPCPGGCPQQAPKNGGSFNPLKPIKVAYNGAKSAVDTVGHYLAGCNWGGGRGWRGRLYRRRR